VDKINEWGWENGAGIFAWISREPRSGKPASSARSKPPTARSTNLVTNSTVEGEEIRIVEEAETEGSAD